MEPLLPMELPPMEVELAGSLFGAIVPGGGAGLSLRGLGEIDGEFGLPLVGFGPLSAVDGGIVADEAGDGEEVEPPMLPIVPCADEDDDAGEPSEPPPVGVTVPPPEESGEVRGALLAPFEMEPSDWLDAPMPFGPEPPAAVALAPEPIAGDVPAVDGV